MAGQVATAQLAKARRQTALAESNGRAAADTAAATNKALQAQCGAADRFCRSIGSDRGWLAAWPPACTLPWLELRARAGFRNPPIEPLCMQLPIHGNSIIAAICGWVCTHHRRRAAGGVAACGAAAGQPPALLLAKAAGAAAAASLLAAVLTEIYLCGVFSCQEILRRNGRTQAARRHCGCQTTQPLTALFHTAHGLLSCGAQTDPPGEILMS
jgi:hypothetical protein